MGKRFIRSLWNFSGDWRSVKKGAKWLHTKYLQTLRYPQTSQVSSDAILFVQILTLLNPCIKQFTLHTTFLSDLTKNFTPGVTKSVIHSIYHDAELDAISGDYTMKPSTNFMFPPWKEHKL